MAAVVVDFDEDVKGLLKAMMECSSAGAMDKDTAAKGAVMLFRGTMKPDEAVTDARLVAWAGYLDVNPDVVRSGNAKFERKNVAYAQHGVGPAGNRRLRRQNARKVVRDLTSDKTIKVNTPLAKGMQELCRAQAKFAKTSLQHGHSDTRRDARITQVDATNFIVQNMMEASTQVRPGAAFNGKMSTRPRRRGSNN